MRANWMVDIEDLTELELDMLDKYYATLSDKAEEDGDIHKSHSIDNARIRQEEKNKRYN